MRELAIQAANGTNDADDITNLEAEFTALSTEITRIGEVTSFAGKALTGTDSTAFSFQVGSGTASANQISVTINSIKSADIGTQGDGTRNRTRAGAAESKQKGQTRSIRMEDFLSWGQFFT